MVFCVGLGLAGAGAVAASVRQEPSGSQTAPAEAKPAPILDGATAFKERGCAQCHTIRGAGGHKGPDLSGVGRRLNKDAIDRQIVNGGDVMPAFGDVLAQQEIEALTDYLHRCRDKQPKVAKAGG